MDGSTSIKQVKANRKNALKSTGPNTPEGKAAVRLNALKHGLLSRQTLLPDEDGAALAELAESLRAALRPVGALEDLLVDSITARAWRLRRLGRVEVGIFVLKLSRVLAARAHEEAADYVEDPDKEILEDLNRRVITDEKKHQQALIRARKAMALQETKTGIIGSTFVEDASGGNAFTKLSRYETAVERSLFRALHELQRLQAARTGQPVLPPVAVDVNVSGVSEDPV